MTHSTRYPTLRRWRRSAAFKQKELARLLGLRTTGAVSRIEQNERVPGLAIAIALEVLTGMPLEELVRPYYDLVEEETLARATAMLIELEESETTISLVKCRHLRHCQERVITKHKSRTMHVQT